jgi:hypothetical protein
MPSLSLAGSIGREYFRNPGTIAGFSLNASPFRDGALQLTFSYSETYDTTSDLRTRNWGPSVRWRFARRAYLDLAYTDTYSRTATATTTSQVLFARINISLG